MKRSFWSIAALSLAGCGSPDPSSDSDDIRNLSTVAEQEAAVDASKSAAIEGFEAFKVTVYKEPFEGGGYIVNGDIHLPTDADLRDFYETLLLKSASEPIATPQEDMEDFSADSAAFAIYTVHGYDIIWNETEKAQLTYCVSTEFNSDYDRVVDAMNSAASRWEAFADVDFRHLAQQDEACDRFNSNVVFDVRPVNVNGNYLARAFFPNYDRVSRNVLIDATALAKPDSGPGLSLLGILRHELGHVLGARHEHTRPEAGTCFEDENFTPVTDYDAYSVMHYPQCNGLGDWSLTLTDLDQNGVACVYGASAAFPGHRPGLCSVIVTGNGG